MYRDIVSLVKLKPTVNDNDVQIMKIISIKDTVFADKKSINRDEFYKAQENGIELKQEFDMRVSEYDNEQVILDENKVYWVKRTFIKNNEEIAIVCTDIIPVIDWTGFEKYEPTGGD